MSHDPFQEREAEKYANPIPSREFILEHLTKREKPANRDELASLPAASAMRCRNVLICKKAPSSAIATVTAFYA